MEIHLNQRHLPIRRRTKQADWRRRRRRRSCDIHPHTSTHRNSREGAGEYRENGNEEARRTKQEARSKKNEGRRPKEVATYIHTSTLKWNRSITKMLKKVISFIRDMEIQEKFKRMSRRIPWKWEWRRRTKQEARRTKEDARNEVISWLAPRHKDEEERRKKNEGRRQE